MSEHRGCEDSISLVRRVARGLGFSALDAEHFSVALQRYSPESLLRITDLEAFQLSLPPVLIHAVRNEVDAARFEKPMRCVVQPPPPTPEAERDDEKSDTSSRPTEVCQCPRGPRDWAQGSGTPQSQLTISPRSLCEEPPRAAVLRAETEADGAGRGPPELQRRSASLEVPPASLRFGAKVAPGGVRPPSTSSTTLTSASSSSSNSAVTGKACSARRIIAAVTRVTPRCRQEPVKKAASSPRSTVRPIAARPQGGSMNVPPRRSDVRTEGSPRTTSPRKAKPVATDPKVAQAPAASPLKSPRHLPASAELPVGRGPRLGKMESNRKAARPGASREDTAAPQIKSQPKTLQEEPVQDGAMPRKGSSLTLGLGGSALNLSFSSNTLLLESPRDLQNLQKPYQGYKLVYGSQPPLSARVPRPTAYSLEVPPGHNRITRTPVVVQPGVVLGLCHMPVRPMQSRGVKSWQPGTS